MDKEQGRRSDQEEYPVTGESPPYSGEIAGVIFVDNRPSNHELVEKAKKFLEIKPGIMKGAKKKKQDVVAFVSSHGKGILVGVGVATIAGIGAVVLHQNKKKGR